MDGDWVYRHHHRVVDLLVPGILSLGTTYAFQIEGIGDNCIWHSTAVSLFLYPYNNHFLTTRRTVIFSGLHLRSILKEIAAPDPSLAGAVTLAWRQLELDFAITACTFSSLGAFFKPFDHAIGASRTNSHYMNSGRRFPKSSHISATRSRTDQDPMVSGTGGIPVLRPDRGETTAAIVSHSPQSDRQSLDSNDSKKGIIMKKQWVVEDDLQR